MDEKEKYFSEHPGIEAGITAIAVVGVIALGVALLFWNAVITYLGWKWFITPLGLPQIGLLYALGLGTFISWFSAPNFASVKKEPVVWLWSDIKRDVAVLTVMWAVHFFI